MEQPPFDCPEHTHLDGGTSTGRYIDSLVGRATLLSPHRQGVTDRFAVGRALDIPLSHVPGEIHIPETAVVQRAQNPDRQRGLWEVVNPLADECVALFGLCRSLPTVAECPPAEVQAEAE